MKTKTGLNLIDATLGGLSPGEVVYVRGDDGSGKTLALLNAAVFANLRLGTVVFYVTHETDETTLGMYITSCASGVDITKAPSEQDYERLNKASDRILKNYFILIDGLKLDIMHTLRHRIRPGNSAGILFIDDFDASNLEAVEQAAQWVAEHGWVGVFSCMNTFALPSDALRLELSDLESDENITIRMDLFQFDKSTPKASCNAILEPKKHRLTVVG